MSSSTVLRRHPDTASNARRFACQASVVNRDVVVGVTVDPIAEPLLRRQRKTAVLSTSWTGGLRGMSTASAPEEEEVRRTYCTAAVAMLMLSAVALRVCVCARARVRVVVRAWGSVARALEHACCLQMLHNGSLPLGDARGTRMCVVLGAWWMYDVYETYQPT